MPALWLINGETPDALRVRDMIRSQVNLGSTSLVLQIGRDVDSEAGFAVGDSMQVTRDGAEWFAGTVRTVTKSGSASDESWSVQCEWPAYLLDVTQYVGANAAGAPSEANTHSKLDLFVDPLTDAAETTVQTLQRISASAGWWSLILARASKPSSANTTW